jgi:hypothetical protein
MAGMKVDMILPETIRGQRGLRILLVILVILATAYLIFEILSGV